MITGIILNATDYFCQIYFVGSLILKLCIINKVLQDKTFLFQGANI